MVLRTKAKGGLQVVNNFKMKSCDKIDKRNSKPTKPGDGMNSSIDSKCLQ